MNAASGISGYRQFLAVRDGPELELLLGAGGLRRQLCAFALPTMVEEMAGKAYAAADV